MLQHIAQFFDSFGINYVARGVSSFVLVSRVLLLFLAGTESDLRWKVSAVLGSCTAGGAYVPAQTLAALAKICSTA